MRLLTIPAAMLAAIALWATPAAAQFTGPGCNQRDVAARMECLRRTQTRPMPTTAPRATTQRCQPSSPCHDGGGRYYFTPFGDKRYMR